MGKTSWNLAMELDYLSGKVPADIKKANLRMGLMLKILA